MLRICSFVVLIGCTGEKEEDELIPMLTGTITPDERDVSGDFFGYRAFAFDANDTLGAYISSNPDATCESISEYLSGTNSEYDPSAVIEGGACNLFLKITDYDGSFSAQDDTIASAASSIECAMGEGEFTYTELGENDLGYYWSGKWWVGVPQEYTWDFSGDGENGYTFEINMTGYFGSFIQEEFDRYGASGDVSGTVTAESCEQIFSSGLFD